MTVTVYPQRTGAVAQWSDSTGSSLTQPNGTVRGIPDGSYLRSPPPATIKRFTDQIGVTINNSGTAATVTVDASAPCGRTALKVAMPAGNTYTEISLASIGLAAFDDHLVWRVWVEDYTAVNQINSYAGTTAYGRFYQDAHIISTSTDYRWNGEHPVVTGPTRASAISTFVAGTDTLDAAKLRILPGAGGANVWIDCVSVVPRGVGIVLLTYDDGFRSWIDYVLPDLAAYGLVATFGVQTNIVGTNHSLYVDSADIPTMISAGHEVVPHQVSNMRFNDGLIGTQTVSQYQTDFRTAAATMRGYSSACRTTFHPFVQGGMNQSLVDALRAEGVRIARGVTMKKHNFHRAGLGRSVLNLRTQSMGSDTASLAAMLAEVDNCAKYGSTFVIMGHDFSPGATPASTLWSTENHTAVCSAINAYIKTGRIIAMRASDYAQMVYQQRLVEQSLLTDWPV